MKKKIEKKSSIRNRENGIALLFSLCILALLLVLTLAFASSSIFDQKTAYNSANMSRTRILAQSAFSKTMVLLYECGDKLKSSGHDADIDPNVPSKDTYNGLTHLNISTPTVMFEWQDSYKDSIGWNYIKKADNELIGRYAYVILPNTLNANNIAKLNVNEGATPYAEIRVGNEVNEINVRSLDPATFDANPALATKFNYTTSSPSGVRPAAGWGGMANMFSLLGLTTSTADKAKLSQWLVVNDTKSEEYFLGNKVNNTVDANVEKFNRFYLPYFTDANANGVFDSATETNKWNDLVTTSPSYSVAQMYDKILLDSDGNGTPDVLPTKWPSGVTNDGYGIPWLAFFGYDSAGVLQNTAANRGTFPSVVDRRRQIAANLVDYCDSNDIPTSDVNPATWTTTTAANDPKFTGNEKTPYINEISFGVEAAISISQGGVPVAYQSFNDFFWNYAAKGGGGKDKKDKEDKKDKNDNGNNGNGNGGGGGGGGGGTTATTTDITVNYKYWAASELIDIYEATYANNLTLILKNVQVSIAITCGANAPVAVNFPATDISIPFASGDWNSGYAVQYSNDFGTGVYSVSIPIANSFGTSVAITKVNFDKAVLVDSSNVGCDFAKVIQNTVTGFVPTGNAALLTLTPVVNNAYATDSAYSQIVFQAKDPRQNLFPADWSEGKKDSDGCYIMSLTVDGFGDVNTNSNPAAAYAASPTTTDLETVTNPAYVSSTGHLSTAYIRNAPMISPWELGFIHRGEAWQTINLKAYDANKAVKYFQTPCMPGGELYATGDANILDQIKMTDKTECDYMKVSLNTTNVNVLRALFDKIQIGSPWLNPGGAGTGTVSIGVAGTDLDTKLSAVFDRTVNNAYVTRAAIANAKSTTASTTKMLSDGTCGVAQDNDAKQEELIGKFINLTEAGEYFNIIILAQSLKDIGTPITAIYGIDIIKKSSDGTKQFEFTKANSDKATRLGIFDYDSGTDIAADEITGEQKIRAQVYRDAAGKCHILRYEYVE